jgi:hypothetical protein
MNWITVDQLPEPMKEVYVAQEDGSVEKAIYVPRFHLRDEDCDLWDTEPNDEDGEYYAREGWYLTNEADIMVAVWSPVTHWMPLPTHPNKLTATPTGEDVGE